MAEDPEKWCRVCMSAGKGFPYRELWQEMKGLLRSRNTALHLTGGLPYFVASVRENISETGVLSLVLDQIGYTLKE